MCNGLAPFYLKSHSRRIAMAKGDRLSRQWKIIQTLISSRRGKSAADLDHDLGIKGLSPRTGIFEGGYQG
jgi:hypothetical protein